ncbi:MAG TPA: DUF4352 domain-containing protein [Bryobacteraceae bacterium]|nr:DUF4352 domain-containing protein [Bryobacteraceae bacterium]
MLLRFRLRIASLTAAVLLLGGCKSQPTGFPVRTYPMGEKVLLGSLTYSVFETEYLTQIGDGPAPRIPQNRFFLVKISVSNGGSQTANVAAFQVEDDNGKVYPELENGDGVPDWIGYLRSVKPAESAQGNAVFDAPPRHYTIRVKDETGEKAALIDIPLTFNAETPDVPIPGDPSKKDQ